MFQLINFRAVFFGIVLLSLTSCAASYHHINPPKVVYNSTTSADGVELGYRYNVLGDSRNRKYVKRENKNGLRVVAVRITNNTAAPLQLGGNLGLQLGDSPVGLVEPAQVTKKIKQNVAGYLPYLLLGFLRLNVTTTTEQRSYPIGLVVGPAITIGNMAMASGANGRFKRELLEYNLLGRPIQPGETVHGLVTLRTSGISPLTPVLK